jgi:hypothetical protein
MSPDDTAPAPPPQAEVEYRDIPGFPGYRVGNDGSVWSCWIKVRKPGRRGGWRYVLGPGWHRRAFGRHPRTGHLQVSLSRPGRNRTYKVHHLVLIAFVGPRPSGAIGLHGDDNPTNNMPENLRWGTPQDNSDDMARNGRQLLGVAIPGAKLCEPVIRSMRLLREGGATLQAIADRFGVSRATACRVLQRRIWGWVE